MFDTKLPDNLTLEDFSRLANREPSFDGKWLYRVTQVILENEPKNPYPKFELDWKVELIYLNFEEALEFIKSGNYKNVYCSWITQFPIGRETYQHGAKWLFDHHGNLVDYTISHSFKDDINYYFFGCPDRKHRFKPGDIVEVISGDEVRLAVVDHTMLTIEECYRVYKDMRKEGLKGYLLDFSDESETVIDGPSYYYHEHVSPLKLLEPRFHIPKELESNMKTWLKTAKNNSNPITKNIHNEQSDIPS